MGEGTVSGYRLNPDAAPDAASGGLASPRLAVRGSLAEAAEDGLRDRARLGGSPAPSVA